MCAYMICILRLTDEILFTVYLLITLCTLFCVIMYCRICFQGH